MVDKKPEKPARRRRAPLTAIKQRLAAPQREGYIRRWVDDSPTRIMEMQELGYDFVQEAAGEGASRTDGVGTRINRLGGKRDSGAPQHLVLMETPVEEYAHGLKEKEAQLAPFEDALRAGKDTTGRMTDSYEPRSDRSSISHTA